MNKSFGEWMRAVRKKKGISMQDLADSMNVSRSYVYQIEDGTRPPSLGRVLEIAALLNADLNTALALSRCLTDRHWRALARRPEILEVLFRMEELRRDDFDRLITLLREEVQSLTPESKGVESLLGYHQQEQGRVES